MESLPAQTKNRPEFNIPVQQSHDVGRYVSQHQRVVHIAKIANDFSRFQIVVVDNYIISQGLNCHRFTYIAICR